MKISLTFGLVLLILTGILIPSKVSAQQSRVVSLSATNGSKGFISPTVKDLNPSPQILNRGLNNPSDAYAGAMSNLPAPPSPVRSDGPASPILLGDDISNPFIIPYIPYSDTNSTCGFTNNYDEICPYSGSTSKDVVYSYSATANITVNIGLCQSSYDTKLYVYDNSYTPGSPIACNDDACGPDGWKSKITDLAFISGHTYYIVVDGYGSTCGRYQLDVVQTPSCSLTCPSGAFYENEPQILNNGSDVTDGGCNFSPPTFIPISIGQSVCGQINTYFYFGNNYRDTDWYRLDLSTATDSTQITWDVVADFYLETIIFKEGTTLCTSTIAIAFSYVPACNHAILTARVSPGIYYLWAGPNGYSSYPAGVATYSYVGTVTGGTIPTNDFCGNAIAINEVNVLPFNTAYASHDGPDGACGLDNDNNIWYDYTATFSGPASASLCGSYYDTKIAVYDGSSCSPPGTLLACNDDYCGVQSSVAFNVISGSHYKIQVGGYYNSGLGYLSVQPYCIPVCPAGATPENEPAIPDGGSDITNGGCELSPPMFSPITLGQTYCGQINTYLKASLEYRDVDWYRLDLSSSPDSVLLKWDVYSAFPGLTGVFDAWADDCMYNTTIEIKSTQPCSHTIITARVKPGKYYFAVTSADFVGYPSTGGPYLYTAKLTGLTIPHNDKCANAITIGAVTNLAFNTTAATYDGTGSCLAPSKSRNLWYIYTPTCTGNATVSLCGSTFDTKMAVYEGTSCTPPGTLLGCNDDYCDVASGVTFPVIYGHSYRIEIGGYNETSYGVGYITTSCTQTLPVNLYLSSIDIAPGQAPCYNATNAIIVGYYSPFIVQNGGSVTMIAGKYIDCGAPVHVMNGGYFHGFIHPAGPYCPVTKEVSTELASESGPADEQAPSGSFFKVYPNPTSGSFTLEFTGKDYLQSADVEIYGMFGKKILSKHVGGQKQYSFSLDSDAPGMYFVRVTMPDKAGSVKLLKN